MSVTEMDHQADGGVEGNRGVVVTDLELCRLFLDPLLLRPKLTFGHLAYALPTVAVDVDELFDDGRDEPVVRHVRVMGRDVLDRRGNRGGPFVGGKLL